MLRLVSIVLLYLLATQFIFGQPKWSQTYLDGYNPVGQSLTVSYDDGFILAGRYGPNYPTMNWLIKTDVNGSVLWNKTIGNDSDIITIARDVHVDDKGNIFLVGSTSAYSNTDKDPIVMKLNPCGEKLWCKVFSAEDNNFVGAMTILPNASIVVLLKYMNPDSSIDRISLAKLTASGELLWSYAYNSPDTNVYNEDAYDITLCPDGGYIVTGCCGYLSNNPPGTLRTKPYFFKTDSLGVFEWEKVINTETNYPGGCAWATQLNPASTFYYSSLSHYLENGDAPAIAKISLSGDLVGVYNLAEPNYYGKHYEFVFLNDSMMAGSAIWGSLSSGKPRAVIYDTLGKIKISTELIDNDFMSNVRKANDGKLLFFTNDIVEQTSEFQTYLFKLDQSLNDDTIYTSFFEYDTLCPYPIVSDTITLEGCDVIVGVSEPDENEYRVKMEALLIYPNPANHIVKIRHSILDAGSRIQIYDLYGRRMDEIFVPTGQQELNLNVSDYPEGIYMAVLKDENRIILRGKFVVKRP